MLHLARFERVGIGGKLTLGFGALAALTLLMVALAYVAARIELQPRRVRVLDEVDALIQSQKARPATPENRELLADLLNFQTSFDAMATNLAAYAASGELNFKLAYGPQLATHAAIWKTLA